MRYLVLPLVLLIFAAPSAFACTCLPSSFESHFENADVVMTAKPSHYRTKGKGWDRRRLTTFFVSTSWKGDVSGEIVLEHRDQNSLCGLSFETGKSVVVFASWTKTGLLSAGFCGQPTSEDDSEERLLELQGRDLAVRKVQANKIVELRLVD